MEAKCSKCGKTTEHYWKGTKIDENKEIYILFECRECGNIEWYKGNQYEHHG